MYHWQRYKNRVIYNIYDDAMLKKDLDVMDFRIQVYGRLIKLVRFADGKAVVESREKGLKKLMIIKNSVTNVTQLIAGILLGHT